MRHILVLSALLALVPVAHAQVNPTWVPMNDIPWDDPALGQGKTVTRMLAGEVWPDLRTDVVALGGTQARDLLFLSGAATNEGVLRLVPTKNVRDFDLTAPDATGVQRIAYLNATGLNQLRTQYNTGIGSYEFVDEVLFTTNGWPTAQRLRTATLDAGTTTDYVGLGLNLKTILVLLNGTTASSFLPGPRIHEILPGDYTGDGNQEIALLMQTGVAVYDSAGTQLWFQSEAHAESSRLARLPGAADGKDALAWLTRPDLDTTTTLRLIALPGGVISASTRTFTNSVFTALTAGDADADGLQDLLILGVDPASPLMILNTGSSSVPAFAAASFSPLGTVDLGETLENVAAPILADLSQDGGLDIVVPACTTTIATFHLFGGEPYGVEFQEWPGEVPPGQPGGSGLYSGVSGYCNGVGIDASNPGSAEVGYHDATPPSGDYTFLEVRVWKRYAAGSTNSHPTCVARTAHYMAGPPDQYNMYRITGLNFSPLSSAEDGMKVVWVDARWITSSSLPNIGESLVDASDPGPTATVVVIPCPDELCSVLPTAWNPETNLKIEAILPLVSNCAPTNCPSGWEGIYTECGINGGVFTPCGVVVNSRPRPPANTVPSMPVQPVRGPDLQPFFVD